MANTNDMGEFTVLQKSGNEYEVLVGKALVATMHKVLNKWYVQFIRKDGGYLFSYALNSRLAGLLWIKNTRQASSLKEKGK